MPAGSSLPHWICRGDVHSCGDNGDVVILHQSLIAAVQNQFIQDRDDFFVSPHSSNEENAYNETTRVNSDCLANLQILVRELYAIICPMNCSNHQFLYHLKQYKDK